MKYQKAFFTLDGETSFEGYHDPSVTWNGFATPVFTKETAQQIAIHVDNTKNGSPEAYTTEWDTDTLLYWDENNNEPTKFEPSVIEYEGESVVVYAVGAFLWTWEEAGQPVAERMAKVFALVLYRWLGNETMREVVAKNNSDEYRGDDLCATHDHCDANMAMDEAFRLVMGRGFTHLFEDDPTEADCFKNSADTDLMNAAWSLAKENDFWVNEPAQ